MQRSYQYHKTQVITLIRRRIARKKVVQQSDGNQQIIDEQEKQSRSKEVSQKAAEDMQM